MDSSGTIFPLDFSRYNAGMNLSTFQQWWQYISDKALADGRHTKDFILEAWGHYSADNNTRYAGRYTPEEIYRRSLIYWHQCLFDLEMPPLTLPARYFPKKTEISGGKSTVTPSSDNKTTPPETTNTGLSGQNKTGPPNPQNNKSTSWAGRTGATGATDNVASQKNQPPRTQLQSDTQVPYDRRREGIPKHEITPCLGVDDENWPFFSISFHDGDQEYRDAYYRHFIGGKYGEGVKAVQKHFRVKFLQYRDTDNICFWVEDENYHKSKVYADRLDRAFRFLGNWALRSPLVNIDQHIQTFEDLEKNGPIGYAAGVAPRRPQTCEVEEDEVPKKHRQGKR